MNAEREAEVKAKLKQLPTGEKIKCCALFKHLKDVYAAQTDCDNKNRAIIFDFVKDSNPLLDQINDIVMGNTELTDEMLEGKEDFFSAEELSENKHLQKEKVDKFYLTVLKKSPTMQEEIKAHDENVLKDLKKIDYSVYADNDDFTLKFVFGENEHFDNEVIEVTVKMDEDGVAEEIKCDTINWKEGKNVCEKTVTKKQKNKKTGVNRTVNKTVPQDSFFNNFKNAKADDEEEDEDAEEPPQGGFATAEEIFCCIKDNVIPFVGPSFFGAKIPELEADPYEDDEEDEDEDYSDEEEEEDNNKGKKKPNAKKNSGADKKDGAEPNKEECKNN